MSYACIGRLKTAQAGKTRGKTLPCEVVLIDVTESTADAVAESERQIYAGLREHRRTRSEC